MKRKFVIIVLILIFVVTTVLDIILRTEFLDTTVTVLYTSLVGGAFLLSMYSMLKDYYFILRDKIRKMKKK